MNHLTNEADASRTRHRVGLVWVLFCGVAAAYFFAKGAMVASDQSEPPSALVTGASAPQAGAWRLKPIEQVRQGEWVWAYDPTNGQWRTREVIKPLEHDFAGDLITLRVGGTTIEATGNHPFWVASGSNLASRHVVRDVSDADREVSSAEGGRWVEARSLQPGDLLIVRNGRTATVEEIAARRVEMKVYNLEVAGLHTYAVGELGIAVHNKSFQDQPIKNASAEAQVAWENGWRTPDGKFASPLGPGLPGAEAESAVWDAIEAKPGWQVIRGRVSFRDATGQLRVYDGVAISPNNRVIGLEVKSGTARLKAEQKAFDTALNKSGPETVPGVGQNDGLQVRRAVKIERP